MLTDLSIKNFAIIDTLHVTFGAGLNVLTGETGAGKSIIIDAVNLLLGNRASAELIRTGAEEASVEAIFAIEPAGAIADCLAEAGIDVADELLIKRIIARSGKNRVFLNGSLATLATLTDVAGRLVNIYGQHESQTLLKVENHLRMLDSYAKLTDQREEYAADYRALRRVQDEMARLRASALDAERQRDILSFQLDEIERAALVAGEDEDLLQERNLLAHAEKLLQKSGFAFELLYGAEESALGLLGRARTALQEAAAVDQSLQSTAEQVATAVVQLEDAALTLRDYAARIEADPNRLQAIDDRLELIRKLQRKYGATIPEILAARDRIAAELQTLTDLDGSLAGLQQEADRLLALVTGRGDKLSAARSAAAGRLQQALAQEVHQLAMKHAVFQVSVEKLDQPRETGGDRVEFLFSPNPGEDPRPLARIASGGELSRIMLAMKQLHPESDVPTLVFDEVDTGIGGATATQVGRKLKAVAARQQVLCITHLPQVAAWADRHYLVAKAVADGRTATSLALLDRAGRVDEIARMLGGAEITATSREHAAEMIGTAAGASN